MDLLPGQSLRFPFFLLGLLTLLSWELARPHHSPAPRRLGRWLENLGLAAINGGALTLVCWACFVIAAREWPPWRFGPFQAIPMPGWIRLAGEVLVLDFLVYWLHRAYHAAPVLWRFHSVHHSDTELDVSTASRFHLGEVAVSGAAKLGAFALLGISPLGLVVFEILLLLAAQFQHANVPLSPGLERALWWALVPPAMHRIHHYPERHSTDSNYGTILTLWDRLFRSLRRVDRPSRFGIEGTSGPAPSGIHRLLGYPFRSSARTR
ncbi:MAG TPA: sterol desaturase family protein [Thermoanaerobaculia bacterium]|nr:sterol desaturase family protein [Thermoanaerobaculia bacterium]